MVREAVDLYLAKAPTDATAALKNTFGAAPDARFPARDEWDTRDERLKPFD